ncbi:MAG: BatA domain-containing protein [Planctomycetota bacterium]|jgi:hypothetical protein
MLAISVVHPAILWGLLLAALPIIIHLLNRRRFKTMEWAAMEFLLKAAVRNRRRVRLESLILLLIRTLIALLLVLAVTRPFTRRSDALASLFGAEGSTERIVLLDDSHSMRAGQGNRSSFDTARQLVKRLIKRLNEERSSDKLTIILGSEPRAGDERFTRVPVASARHKRMLERIDKLKVSDGSLDVATAVEAILETHEDRGTRLVLHVVSDFRRRDWVGGGGEMLPGVKEALARFQERGEVRLIDVGSLQAQNVGVVELRPRDRAVIAGVPTAMVATVRNHGPEPVANVQVTFDFGGRRSLPVKLEGTVPPGEEREVVQEFTFQSDGPVVVTAQTRTDILPGDDIRRRVVDVRRTMRFLLVDGEPEQEHFRGETDFLAAALSPPGRIKSGIEVDPVSEVAFSGRELEAYDGVFLCNVYRLPDDRIKLLEEYVREGGGLVFFLGDQVDPQVYNTVFFGKGGRFGKGLLPLQLAETEGSLDDYVHLAAPVLDHPVVRFLRGVNQIIFRTVAIQRWIRCEAPSQENVSVILSYTDEAGSPALAERSFGEGRVMLFSTAADREWSDFPQSPLYLALLQEIARYVVKPDPASNTLLVSDEIEIAYDPRHMQRQASLVPPAALGGAPVRLTLTDGERGGKLYFRYDNTTVAGEYVLRLNTPEGEERRFPFAVNVDPTEGDLSEAEISRLSSALPGLKVERAGEEGVLDTDASDRAEFWRTLVYLLIALAALETLLAWRFGHHAKRKLAPEGKQVFVR